MDNEVLFKNNRHFPSGIWKRMLLILAVFGPATITAMADNDAGGIATYSLAGAKLGYTILFLLPIITLLLAITQEMGMRLTVITRRGLADLIREQYGVRAAMFMFGILLIAAERLRGAIGGLTGRDVAVDISDSFGRPWRAGTVGVAIGCAGLPAVLDLRGDRICSEGGCA